MRTPAIDRPTMGFALAGLAALAVACSHSPAGPGYTAGSIDAKHVVPKVSEFVVIVDGSLSMADYTGGDRKVAEATAVATALVNTVPDGELPGTVRSFGQGPCLPEETTSALYSSTSYAAADAAAAVAKVGCAGGHSPLDQALDATGSSLQTKADKLVVFIVSDGLHMNDDEVAAAKRLDESRPGGACFFPIQIGDTPPGKKLLARIAGVSDCGRLVKAADLAGGVAMGDFVMNALFEMDPDGDGVGDSTDACPDTPEGVQVDAKGCPLDSDGDGVPDYLDKCPGTPAGVKVDAKGCPLDSDGDGVTDDKDKCPGTPPNTKVDEHGCPLPPPVEPWQVSGDVLFDFDKSVVRKDAQPVLDQIAEWLARNPTVTVAIEGHTDSIGSDFYNQKLSERRSAAVKAYLVGKGVAEGRLTTSGKGESAPVVANDNKENRQKNRRVEFIPKR